jgi:arylsulfatase A-like enzyme
LRGFKMQTWEGGIRVAWIVQWKGHIPVGKVDDRPVIQLDILPTALAAADVAVQPDWNLDGVNLLPYLTGKDSGLPHEALYWRLGQQMAIRAGDWKLVKSVGSVGVEAPESHQKANTQDAELYNVTRDIGERENLAANEPAKVGELSAAWNKWSAAMAEPSWYANRGAGKNSKKARK